MVIVYTYSLDDLGGGGLTKIVSLLFGVGGGGGQEVVFIEGVKRE